MFKIGKKKCNKCEYFFKIELLNCCYKPHKKYLRLVQPKKFICFNYKPNKKIDEMTKGEKILILVYILEIIYDIFVGIVTKNIAWFICASLWILVAVQEILYKRLLKRKDDLINNQEELINKQHNLIEKYQKRSLNMYL